MSDHIQKTISDVQQQIAELESELSRKKKMVNDLADLAGLPTVYHDTSVSDTPTISSIRRDQWYGQPLATAIREYLEMRRVANLGPATVNEIYDALTHGGFKFDTKDEANAKRGLRISLTKNTAIFHRLPDKRTYGLLDWYPDVKLKKSKNLDDASSSADGADDDTAEDDASSVDAENDNP